MEGLGDVVDHITTKTGIKILAKGAAEVAHYVGLKETSDCGCDKRKEVLNNIVPFNNKQ